MSSTSIYAAWYRVYHPNVANEYSPRTDRINALFDMIWTNPQVVHRTPDIWQQIVQAARDLRIQPRDFKQEFNATIVRIHQQLTMHVPHQQGEIASAQSLDLDKTRHLIRCRLCTYARAIQLLNQHLYPDSMTRDWAHMPTICSTLPPLSRHREETCGIYRGY